MAEAREIEITPQMIEVGIAVLLDWMPEAIGDSPDHRMIAAIYLAMATKAAVLPTPSCEVEQRTDGL